MLSTFPANKHLAIDLPYQYGYGSHYEDVACRELIERGLIKAKTMGHLQQGLGRYDRQGSGKYHEARYVWLNLLSLYQLGSIEFRLFNSISVENVTNK